MKTTTYSAREWPPIWHRIYGAGSGTYDWQLFPAYPPQLVMPDGEPRAEVLDALTPPGWTRTAADINAGGIYVQGTDEQGHMRLLLKAWVGNNTGGYYVDSITQPLPQGTWINPQPLGMEATTPLCGQGGHPLLLYLPARPVRRVGPRYIEPRDDASALTM